MKRLRTVLSLFLAALVLTLGQANASYGVQSGLVNQKIEQSTNSEAISLVEAKLEKSDCHSCPIGILKASGCSSDLGLVIDLGLLSERPSALIQWSCDNIVLESTTTRLTTGPPKLG